MHKLVEQLTSAYAVSGDERCLHDILRSALDGIADEIHDTPLGNLIAVRKGRSSEHSILFAAHLDEVGAWVTRINDKGFLGIHCRSIDGRVWPGLQVVVHGTEAVVLGLSCEALVHKLADAGRERDGGTDGDHCEDPLTWESDIDPEFIWGNWLVHFVV